MNRNGHESTVWATVRSKMVGAMGRFPQLSLTENTIKRLFPLVLMCANSWFIEVATAQPIDARANGQNSPQNSRAVTPGIVKLPADSKFLEVAKFYGSHLIDVPPSEPPGQARVIWQAFRQNRIWLQLLYSPLGGTLYCLIFRELKFQRQRVRSIGHSGSQNLWAPRNAEFIVFQPQLFRPDYFETICKNGRLSFLTLVGFTMQLRSRPHWHGTSHRCARPSNAAFPYI